MIELLAALTLQAAPAEASPGPVLAASDLCVELQGRGAATIGGERFRGRALARAVADRLPANRPLFIRFANERAANDIEGMTAVMSGGVNASEIVIVDTCELPTGASAQ